MAHTLAVCWCWPCAGCRVLAHTTHDPSAAGQPALVLVLRGQPALRPGAAALRPAPCALAAPRPG